jgi:hypothetical protein
MTDKSEKSITYATSSDAYRAIHASLADAVRAALDDADQVDAMKYAALMREIEEHTDVLA